MRSGFEFVVARNRLGLFEVYAGREGASRIDAGRRTQELSEPSLTEICGEIGAVAQFG